MSHVSPRPDQSTTAEAELLTALNNLATSSATQAIQKTGASSFANVSIGGGGSGTVTSVSVTTANGVSGTVATATTTPAITLALGAITPSAISSARITKRAPTVTQSATPTINTEVTDVAHITGLAQAITSMTTNLTGTPVEGDTLRIDITDNGTARAITWGAKFEASTVALPTTTVLSVRLDVGFVWNTVTSAWRCVATA